jgi:hypothetical protein
MINMRRDYRATEARYKGGAHEMAKGKFLDLDA